MNDSVLFIQKKVLFLPLKRTTYNTAIIKTIRIEYDEQAEAYWSFTAIPNERFYYYNPTVLYFAYNGKEVKIGEGMRKFDVEELKVQIEKRSSSGGV
ncbi:MAG: hypothetical protein KA149_03630 [Chitinophagales bacterium]|nr:hypothetical protein [Chitinophagales bacterium]